jgi:AcrR family transcriptional regulator
MISNQDIEQKIFTAAKAVFLEKGLEASTMSDIAKRAGISRTLLNYYHRKKEKLFQAILIEAVREMLPKIERIVRADTSLMKKLELILDSYIQLLFENPLLPYFMQMEMNRDPHAVIELFYACNHDASGMLLIIEQQLHDELDLPSGYPMAHFFVSFYGLMFFPFMAKAALDEVFFRRDPKAFADFIMAQKPIVLGMISGLQKKKRPVAHHV